MRDFVQPPHLEGYYTHNQALVRLNQVLGKPDKAVEWFLRGSVERGIIQYLPSRERKHYLYLESDVDKLADELRRRLKRR